MKKGKIIFMGFLPVILMGVYRCNLSLTQPELACALNKPRRLLHQEPAIRITSTVPSIPGTHINQRFRNYSVFLNHKFQLRV